MAIEYNPFDDERLAEIRKSQEDPVVQYYVVRTDIPMSAGKIGAQIAHGAQMFAFAYMESLAKAITNPKMDVVKKWLDGSFRKVVLGGKEKDFEKIKNELDVFLVRDAGLTEVDCGTETVLVTWPQLRSQCPKILKKLQTLK